MTRPTPTDLALDFLALSLNQIMCSSQLVGVAQLMSQASLACTATSDHTKTLDLVGSIPVMWWIER